MNEIEQKFSQEAYQQYKNRLKLNKSMDDIPLDMNIIEKYSKLNKTTCEDILPYFKKKPFKKQTSLN